MRSFVVLLLVAVGGLSAADDGHHCTRRLPSFAGVTLHGGFAHDRGCRWQSYTLGGKQHQINESASALVSRGWVKAGDAARAQLAQAWVAEALYEPGDFLVRAPQPFPGTFTPPTATARDGGVVVRGWTRLPAGQLPETRYEKIEVVFDREGNLASQRAIESAVQPATR